MAPSTVLFFGPQGAGKGTQVKLLIEEIKKRSTAAIIHIDMGQLLRNMVAIGGYSAKLTANVIENGALMPDFMPIFLTSQALVNGLVTGEEHIIADGLARRPDQTRAWDDSMQFYGRNSYSVIDLQLTEEESIKRLLLRGRNDDTEEAIKRRLGWHKAEVEPQLQLLGDRGRTIHHIDGGRTIEEVHVDVVSALRLS